VNTAIYVSRLPPFPAKCIMKRVRKIAKSGHYVMSVSACLCMEQLGSDRTGFHEIRFECFGKSVDIIQV